MPRGIRKSINRYCMRNCQEVLENLSMRNWLKKLPGSIRKFVNEKLPWDIRNCLEALDNSTIDTHEKLARGIRKFVNGCCMRNWLEVLENLSMRNYVEELENLSMSTAWEIT